MELHHLQHAVPSSQETCFTQRLDFHRKQIYGTSNQGTHLCSPNNNSSVCLTKTINCRRGALGGSPMKYGEGGQPCKAPNVYLRHQHPHPLNERPMNSLAPGSSPQYLCLTFPLQLLHGIICYLCVWRRRTNRQPFRPATSHPLTSLWTARASRSGRWDNRMVAKHLPRDLVGSSNLSKNWLKGRRT